MPEPAIADVMIEKLAVHLGPHVARMAIKTFAKKAGISSDEPLTLAQVPKLIEELRPMLKVMIGSGPSEAVVADISRAIAAHRA